ncbi:hypothetical protein CROQUDRAFT_48907, partial [Cronartium quercuum f. sp. fusiforme G11]
FSQVQRLKRKCPPKKVDPKKSDSGLFEVDDHTYVAMLEYYQQKDSAWYDYQSLDLPEGAKVLTPYATEVQSMEVGAVRFNRGNGNKVVEYIKNGVRTWGIVTHCLKGEADSLVCLRNLEVIENEVLNSVMKRIGLVQLKDVGQHTFIEATAINETRSYRFLAAWSLGYEGPSMLVNVQENIIPETLDLEL